MKTFYTTRLEQVTNDIQKLEYQIKILKAELTELEPLATVEREQFVAERTEKAENVLVQHESGAFFTAKDLLKIKNGELIVEVKKPKKVREPEPTVEFIDVTPEEQAEIDKPISTPKKKSWLKSK